MDLSSRECRSVSLLKRVFRDRRVVDESEIFVSEKEKETNETNCCSGIEYNRNRSRRYPSQLYYLVLVSAFES